MGDGWFLNQICSQKHIKVGKKNILRDFFGFPSGSDCLQRKETRVCSLGREDPLEKGMATHSSVLAWRIPWTEEPHELQPMGLQRVRHE